MTKILISGANGALGIGLSRHFDSLEDVSVHRLTRSELDFETGIDIKSTLKILLSDKRPDFIFHCAASFLEDGDISYAVNVLSTRYIFECISELNLQCRIVVIGSAAEYGLILPSENPIAESRHLKPISVYGLTKTWQTNLSQLYSHRGLDVVVARIFNLDSPEISSSLFIGRLNSQIKEIQLGKRSKLEFGALTAIRDYISVDRAIEFIISISKYGISGEVYHVASGVPTSMNDILVDRLSKFGININDIELIQTKSNRVGVNVPVVYADISKTLQLEKLK